MNFSSDNVAGAHESVLRAVVEASTNSVPAYGDDALSAEAETALQNLFETECAVFFCDHRNRRQRPGAERHLPAMGCCLLPR